MLKVLVWERMKVLGCVHWVYALSWHRFNQLALFLLQKSKQWSTFPQNVTPVYFSVRQCKR